MLVCHAQEIPSFEQQLENLTDLDQSETEDDSHLQQLEYFRKNKINLNEGDIHELKELRILTDLQISNLISYRHLLGKLINLYELQAIPTWDLHTIKKVLPFITIYSPISLRDDLITRLAGGTHSLLFRWSQVIEKAKGYDPAAASYLGSPQKLFFRYRYAYKNILQWGIAGDKDAGEQFFKGSQKKGFDFYSFHVFVRKIGILHALALGDFTVNMGQGLIQWQSIAFKKSVEVINSKRQSAILQPYNSAGEFNFNRGIGVTLKKGNFEATGFASVRKLNANITEDPIHATKQISSFLLSGYHRTEAEIADKNNVRQTSFGSTLKYAGKQWHVAVNGVYHNFSLTIQKKKEAYNLFAITGKSWYNVSIDYSYTYKNLHYFGEAAIDRNFSKAFLNGLLLSVDPKIDVSIVTRCIAKNYQAVNANAFTENTFPSNENGFYTGITVRPSTFLKLDMYGDVYKFPWLKFRVDAPSRGRDFLAQLTYTPNKRVEVYTRFKNEAKQINQSDNSTATNYLVQFPKKNWRIHFSYNASTTITLRNRAELVWLSDSTASKHAEKGFLAYFDFLYKPLLRPYAGLIRLQYFETDGYSSRLYAYENDVLYSYSIPVFYDKGYRYYMTVSYDFTKKFSFWVRWAQTIYQNKATIGSGLDEIFSNKKSEIKLQVRYVF